MEDSYFYSLDGPLEAMPTESQMRSANLNAFSGLVRSLGGDPRALLERFHIDPRLLRDPDQYINCQSLVDLLEYCSTSLHSPLFGIDLGQLQEPDVFGCVTALCRAAPSFREAINSFIAYLPCTHSPTAIMELIEGDDVAELRWYVRTDLGINTQANYQAVMLNLKLLKQLGGPGFHPSYVNLAVDARHKDILELERRIGCRFHPTHTENAIAFPMAMLDHPVSSASRLLFKLLGGYLERVKMASRTSLTERVQDYVRGSLPTGNCSIERCAQKLGMSVRTLQAKLGEADLMFSDILEHQRIDLAKAYLKQEQFSLDDVAANLGYSEQSSFGRAFKRWTGMTPKLYRRDFGIATHPETEEAQPEAKSAPKN